MPGEAASWARQEPLALAAVDFWNRFLRLAAGASLERPLDAVALRRLVAIVRAVSWVESRHGTATTNQGPRDPMQCGHPLDAWWRELITPGTAGQDRFVTGKGGRNYWAGDLPEAAERDPDCPAEARLSALGTLADGHDDPAFGPVLSYFWGVPLLVHKINTGAGAPTFRCGDLSRERLIDGAVAYNGGGDPQYRAKIEAALVLTGGLAVAAKARGAARAAAAAAPAPAIADVLTAIASVLARATRGRGPARVVSASIRVRASCVDAAWFATPIAGASGESTVVATLAPPFAAPRATLGGEDLEPVVIALAALLDDVGASAPAALAVDVPLDLGWVDGAVTVSLATASEATHTLSLAVERRRR